MLHLTSLISVVIKFSFLVFYYYYSLLANTTIVKQGRTVAIMNKYSLEKLLQSYFISYAMQFLIHRSWATYNVKVGGRAVGSSGTACRILPSIQPPILYAIKSCHATYFNLYLSLPLFVELIPLLCR